jgi:sulfate transport system permease protein
MRWAVIYGTILTVARALGEYGAVNLVSSEVVGKSLTLPLYVDNSVSSEFNPTAAYSAGLLLALISLVILLGMTTFSNRRRAEDTE